MKKEDVIKKHEWKKCISLSIRITPAMSKWLKKNNFSPTAIFNEGCKDLGFKE